MALIGEARVLVYILLGVGLVSFATFCGVDFSSNLGWGAIISGGWGVKNGGFFLGGGVYT